MNTITPGYTKNLTDPWLDDLGGLLKGRGRDAVPVELLPDEHELYRTPGSANPGSLRSIGGDVIVTNRRLLFAPLNVSDVAALLDAGLQKAGAPASATTLVGWLTSQINSAATSTAVTSVRLGQPASLVRPPTVIISGSDGTTIELGITASRLSANSDRDNDRARQEVIAAVQATITLNPQPDRGQALSDRLSISNARVEKPGPAPRVEARTISATTAALTASEAEASLQFEESGSVTRVFMPLARGRSGEARLDPRLVGRWILSELGFLTFLADGSLQGTLQLFGALPPGTATGEWWIDGTPAALVLNFLCVQTSGEIVIEFASSWPLVIQHVDPNRIAVSIDGEDRVFFRQT